MSMKQIFSIPLVAIMLLLLSPANAAREDTVQAIIPWEAEGRVFQVETNKIIFLGAMKGVMYVETSKGELHEAFVMCPIMQEMDLESGATNAIGRCEITVSSVDVLYAKLSCEGRVGECVGEFTLIDGEGKFAGISGSGKLRVRSPMHALIADMSGGQLLRVASGLAIIDDLKYSVP